MTATDWAHLPNAAHIDRVIASSKANPDQWASPREESRNAVRDSLIQQVRAAAWGGARDILREQNRVEVWIEARDAAWNTAWNTARYFAQYAILALVAYDDCAYMLDSDPGELAILAAFGDPRAILLFGACKVFHALKDIV